MIEVDPAFYQLATASLSDDRRLVLKHGETFAVFDPYGDIKPIGLGDEGIYHEGTRYLSGFLLRLAGERPHFLSSTVKEDNALLTVDLTNRDMFRDGQKVVPHGSLHVSRTKFLWQGVCHERIRITNFGFTPAEAPLSLHFDADFADIFEVRGRTREKRGRPLEPVIEDGCVVLAYEGLDGLVRRTRLEFSPSPREITSSEARFSMVLEPSGEAMFTLTFSCLPDGPPSPTLTYEASLWEAAIVHTAHKARNCQIHSSSDLFNDWVNRSVADLAMMTTETTKGPYPYAGVPWFSTPFGRDGIITALEALWVDPELARGVLTYLAATQADAVSAAQDAEPGKILHETRKGEMAALHEIPFGLYYGSVDSTPLFVMLASAYYERTGDRAVVEALWPNIERALAWIDTYGDADGDGFVEYQRKTAVGLEVQGWKDSPDSIFHADGRLAEGAIALCEVQGYVYAAKRGAAHLATVLGKPDRTAELIRQAEELQDRFDQVFWCEDLATYALALDGQKQPCRIRTSNAGHCLLTGIATRDHAKQVAHTLLGPNGFSGWGIRTVAAREVRYNPMSYHNGSIWPHDNALIALGLARYGLMDSALQVMTSLYDASLFVDLHRLPELFCGFIRRPGEGPTLYPVACSPQSWSAATVFMLLQACLGMEVKGPEGQVCFTHPVLPEFLQEVRIRNLRIGQTSVDLYFERHDSDVGVNVLKRQGDIKVVVIK